MPVSCKARKGAKTAAIAAPQHMLREKNPGFFSSFQPV